MSSNAAVAEAPIEVAPTPKPTPVIGQTTVEPGHVMAADMVLAAAYGDKGALATLQAQADASRATKAETVKTEPVKTEPVVESTTEEVTEEAKAELEATEEAAAVAEETAAIESIEPGVKPEKGFRARFKDPEDVAIATLARTQNISLAKAAEIRAQITKPQEQTQEETVEQPKADPTITALEAQVDALKQQVRQTKQADALDESLPDLEDKLNDARMALAEARGAAKALADARTIFQQEKAATTQAEFGRQIKAAEAEVAKDFPDYANPESALKILCDAMAVKMQDPKHPDHAKLYEPGVIRFLAEKNAPLLNLKPKASAQTQTTKTEKEPARPVPGSRGSAPQTPKQTAEQVTTALRELATRAIAGGHYGAGTTMLGGTIIL